MPFETWKGDLTVTRIFLTAVVSVMMIGATAPAFSQEPAKTEEEKKKTVRRKRMDMQQKRINQGVKEGDLTKKEAAKLEMKEGALAKEVREEKKDGGGLTTKEKAKINRKQDKISKDIYKERHDAQTKKP